MTTLVFSGRILTGQAPLVHPGSSTESIAIPSFLGQRNPDLSGIDLGIRDTALSGQDRGLMAMGRVEGPLGPDRVARVLRSESHVESSICSGASK